MKIFWPYFDQYFSLGKYGCKVSIYAMDIFLASDSYILAIISIDRYLSICKSNKRYITRKWGMVALILPWILGAIVYSPMPYMCNSSHDPSKISCDCNSAWSSPFHYQMYSLFIVTMVFVVPMLAMFACYTSICIYMRRVDKTLTIGRKSKSGVNKRVVKMLIVATSLFVLSWTPYLVMYVLKKFNFGDKKLFGWVFFYTWHQSTC